MPQPKPPTSLDNSCAAIRDDTLYVYTPDGFQSIGLKEGAKWKKLAMGESVTGAACVGSTPANSDAAGFWVVGGTGGTTGLQKYTYSTGKWETLTPQGSMTENRQFHGVSYLESDDLLLMFAGTTDGSEVPTGETFTIHTSEPYQVDSYPSAAPNSIRPMLLRKSDTEVLMVGGGASNTAVYVFKTTGGWMSDGASLAEPIAKDTTQIQGALVKGDDDSENLYLFDMTQSPNEVTRYVIQDASGEPVASAPALTKRQSSEDDWPDYNSTLASTNTREDYGIAQGSDGTVVFTGGNTKEPLAMFDAFDNGWLDTDKVFSSGSLSIQDVSSSSTESSTATRTQTSETGTSTAESTSISSASATATDVAPEATSSSSSDSSEHKLPSNTILGITLGSIFGLLTVLIIILCVLKRRKTKNERAAAAAAAAADGPRSDRELATEKNMDFADSPPMVPRGHQATGSTDSYSSMAILMGRANQQPKSPNAKGNDVYGNQPNGRYKDLKSTISKPIPQEDTLPLRDYEKDYEKSSYAQPTAAATAASRPRDGPPPADDGVRRSSGWNKYWSGGSSLQILGFGGKRATVQTDRSSRYSQAMDNGTSTGNSSNDVSNKSRVTQDSATVPPLNFEGRTAMSRVNSGSPVVTGRPQELPFGEGMAGKIERSNSGASLGAYSSGVPESVTDVWVPPNDQQGRQQAWGTERAPSSVYEYNTGAAGGYGASSLNPGGGSKRQGPSGVSTQPQLEQASKSSDMSWLNLGDQPRR